MCLLTDAVKFCRAIVLCEAVAVDKLHLLSVSQKGNTVI